MIMLTKTSINNPLALLRKPFEKHQISKLPKPTKKQTDDLKNNPALGIRCKECGGWHHKDVVHLDYVGHAALTDRLLDVDSIWGWEPLAYDSSGLPLFDSSGGLWIKLTILGCTRLGYGHAKFDPNKDPGAREKEVIGDAIRNAAMRYGAALDLWHKGDLHIDEYQSENKKISKPEPAKPPTLPELKERLARQVSLETLSMTWHGIPYKYKVQELINFAGECKIKLQAPESKDDWTKKIEDAKSVEEAQEIYNSMSAEDQIKYNDAIDFKIDSFR